MEKQDCKLNELIVTRNTLKKLGFWDSLSAEQQQSITNGIAEKYDKIATQTAITTVNNVIYRTRSTDEYRHHVSKARVQAKINRITREFPVSADEV